MGPAEQEEGGSLQYRVSDMGYPGEMVKLWRQFEASAPRSRRASCEQTIGGAVEKGPRDIPAEICEFLVDALESHGYGCVCVVGRMLSRGPLAGG